MTLLAGILICTMIYLPFIVGDSGHGGGGTIPSPVVDAVNVTNLGSAIEINSTYNGVWHDGLFYGATRDGETGRFYRYNPTTEAVDLVVPLAAGGAWAIAEHEDSIYIGTFWPASLYRYDTATGSMVLVQAILGGHSFVWDITADGSSLYMGTYPDGHVYRYDAEAAQMDDMGKVGSGQYVRTVAAIGNRLYAGTGTMAELIEYNLRTGEQRSILPDKYAGDSFTYDLVAVGNDLFIGLDPSNAILRYDSLTGNFDELSANYRLDEGHAPTFAPWITHYLGLRNHSFEYNYLTGKLLRIGPVDSQLSGGTVGKDGISGITRYAEYVEIGADGTVDKLVDFADAGLEPVRDRPYALAANNGTVVTTRNKLRVVDCGVERHVVTLGEPKVASYMGDSLIFAVYQGATVWQMDGDTVRRLFRIGHDQDRPLSIDTTSAAVAIGTMPDYGMYGGAVTYYDGGEAKVLRLSDHSVSAVAIGEDGHLYAGTLDSGGLGTAPLGTSSRVMQIRVEDMSIVSEYVVEAGSIGVSDMAFFDGNLYVSTAAGNLYRVDSGNGEIAQIPASGVLKLQVSAGEVYAISRTTLYVIDRVGGRTVLVHGGFTDLSNIAWDRATGDIYLIDGFDLVKVN